MCCRVFGKHGSLYAPVPIVRQVRCFAIPLCFAQCAPPDTGYGMCFFLNRIAHGAWGETLLFPPWPPFSHPCVRVCTGMLYPVLKRSGLSAVALAKVESTVTCQRVLPAPCVRVCTGMFYPVLKQSGLPSEALAKEGQSWTESQPSRPGKALGEQEPTGASA